MFKFIIALGWVLIFGGCTTFSVNQPYFTKACKSGVNSYDDGSVNFTCAPKEPAHDREEE